MKSIMNVIKHHPGNKYMLTDALIHQIITLSMAFQSSPISFALLSS